MRGPRGGMILCQEAFAKAVNKQIFPGSQGGPLMHVIAAKAVCFKEALSQEFKDYQMQIVENAKALASDLQSKGYNLISGGTDTHLFLMDLTKKDITGKDAEQTLEQAGITVNKNTIPFEARSPFITSGIRIGTPAVTTRGMKQNEMEIISGFIDESLNSMEDEGKLNDIKARVKELCESFPIYKHRLSAGVS
jgi:glycine hydroxymethyltransferase